MRWSVHCWGQSLANSSASTTQAALFISATSRCPSWHVCFVLLQVLNCKEAKVADSDPMTFIFLGTENFPVFTFILTSIWKWGEFIEKSRFLKFLGKWDVLAILGPHSRVATISWDSAGTPPLESAHAHQFTPVPTTPSCMFQTSIFKSFTLLPGSGSNCICLFSSTKTTEGPATGTAIRWPRARRMTCTCYGISMHPLYHPSFPQAYLNGGKKYIQPILWAENFNWSQTRKSWNEMRNTRVRPRVIAFTFCKNLPVCAFSHEHFCCVIPNCPQNVFCYLVIKFAYAIKRPSSYVNILVKPELRNIDSYWKIKGPCALLIVRWVN